MPRWSRLCSASCLLCCSLAHRGAWAQAAPAEPPTEARPPAAPPPPAAEPAPPAAPPPSAPEAPPPPSSLPAADAFPAPAPTPPAPAARRAPRSSEQAPAAAPPPAEKPQPQRFTEGLFEEKARPAGTALPPNSEPVHHHEDESDDEKVDHFKIGPVVGTGVPSVLSIGGTLKLTRYLGAGVNVGIIPKVQLSYYGDATLSYQHYDIYGRVYPFGGGFFLGAGAGYATIEGTLTRSFEYQGVSARYDSVGSVRTLMLTALIGYFYTTSIGFSIGLDAGAQIPIAPSQIEYGSSLTGNFPAQFRSTIEQQFLGPTDKSVRDTLETIGRTTLPTVNLRIGWIL